LYAYLWFQSLAGFFVACNLRINFLQKLGPVVSIPGGFFRGLQRGRHPHRKTPDSGVSIPGGFFRGLQRQRDVRRDPDHEVSIPGGFFRGLQLARLEMKSSAN